jgi:hypothetical protein
MSDDSERLAKRKADSTWTPEQLAEYQKARHDAAMARIFDRRRSREAKVETRSPTAAMKSQNG